MNEMTAVPERHKFDADSYFAMGKAGFLPERGVELIDGDILDMAPFARDRGMRRKFDADTFFAMAKAALFQPDTRVELIGGDIVDMAPIGPEHGGDVAWFHHTLAGALGAAAIIWNQSPLRLNDTEVAYPDLLILKPRTDFYRHCGGPTPADALLLIEVAESSLRVDTTKKAVLYARNWIPEYWVLDVAARRLLVHRQPGYGGYAAITMHQPGETLTLAANPAVTVLFDPPA